MEKTQVDILMNLVKCSCCNHPTQPLVFTCSLGHNFCGECIEFSDICPLCQYPTRRNRLMDNLCFVSTLKCSFAKNGCPFSDILPIVAGHEKNCRFSSEQNPNRITDSESVEDRKSGKNACAAKEFRMQTLEETICGELQCPVCYKRISPPITECENGHRTCDDCLKEIDWCPVCRGVKSVTHNIFLENIFYIIELPCRNEGIGCQVRQQGRMILEHEKSCPSFNIRCPLVVDGTCNWTGCRSGLIDHFIWVHFGKWTKESPLEWLLPPSGESTFNLVILYDLFRFGWALSGNHHVFVINHFGEYSVMKQYYFTLTLVCCCCQIERKSSGRIYPYDANLTIHTGKYVKYPVEVFQNHLGRKIKYRYTLKIFWGFNETEGVAILRVD